MRRLVLAICFFLPSATVAAQDVATVLDTVFADWRRTDAPGCTVGIEYNGARTIRAYGMANLEYGVPLSATSVMESGSVAKQFTVATVLLLAQQGKLSLDDDIRKHLPEVPDFGKVITIRNLLQHTSGLRDQWGLLALQGHPPGEEVHTLPLILDLVHRQQQLNFLPGEEYLYSNTGFALAAMIVSRVSGRPFAQFSRESLFVPLGMKDTQWRDDYRRVVPQRSTAYAWEGGVWVQDMPFTMVHGNGGLLSTMDDLLTWNAALTNGTAPLAAGLVRQMEQNGHLNDGSAIDYALGLTVTKYRGTREVSHGGSTAGYRTFLARWPERGLSAAVFCNAANANPARLIHQVAEKLLNLPNAEVPPGPMVEITAAELEQLTGTYRDSTSDDRLAISVKDGHLFAAPVGAPGVALIHLGQMRFWSELSGDLRFERSGSTWRAVRYDNAWRRFDRESPLNTSSIVLADYTGRYRSAELDIVFDVRRNNGRLTIARPEGTFPLVPAYADGFASMGRTFRFVRARDGGRVNAVLIYAGRVRRLRAERVE